MDKLETRGQSGLAIGHLTRPAPAIRSRNYEVEKVVISLVGSAPRSLVGEDGQPGARCMVVGVEESYGGAAGPGSSADWPS